MERLGQKNGDEQIYLLRTLPPVASSISGKVSNRKRSSLFLRLRLRGVSSCIFAEQLSLRRCAVRYMHALTRPRCRASMRISAHAVCRFAEGRPLRLCAAGSPDGDLRLEGNAFCGLRAMHFACTTASALLTKRNSLPMPRFRPTCGRKYRTRCAPIRQARPTEQQPIIMIRRVAQRNPSQIARNFEATALSGQP
jgi:hypothetical protein